jgi:hypothetical protein
MADWVEKAQNAWKTNATEKNLNNYPNAIDYVNYNNKLLDQRLDHRYYVVYTAGGTHIASVIVDCHQLSDFHVGKAKISPIGFVPDVTTFYYSTNDLMEAHYLTAVLNSTILDEMIKPHQTKGKFGPRHIHRRPFEFYIPEFNDGKKLHRLISFRGIKAVQEAAVLQKASRQGTKMQLGSIDVIDKLVAKLLK